MIIAEIGQNHCGDMNLAHRLIELAKDGGADLVKFQLYDHKKLYGDKDIPNVELSKEQAFELFDYGKKNEIEVFFSVFDVERVRWCEEMGVKRYKISANLWDGKIATFEAVYSTSKPMIISMRLKILKIVLTNPNHCILYCPEGYPQTEIKFDADIVGFSDHTMGLDAAKIALARGAQIIEKHFAIDHRTGIDAPWSMDYQDLKELKRWENVCKDIL